MKKKGWGEAKIQKWVRATEPSEKPRSRNDVVTLVEWSRFLSAALSLKTTPYVGILGHWYRGVLSDEDFQVESRVRRCVEDLSAPGFKALTEDIVYDFRPREAAVYGTR